MSLLNFFLKSSDGDSAAYSATITPSDTNSFPQPTRGIYVGTSGDVTVISANDDSDTPVLFKSVPQGTLLPIKVKTVMATNTTATNLVALW